MTVLLPEDPPVCKQSQLWVACFITQESICGYLEAHIPCLPVFGPATSLCSFEFCMLTPEAEYYYSPGYFLNSGQNLHHLAAKFSAFQKELVSFTVANFIPSLPLVRHS